MMKISAEKKTLVVLYGSQTGNAEDLARRIGYRAKTTLNDSDNYQIVVQTIDDFKLASLPKQDLVIFVCSTTGHGQEPENMKKFYNFIRRRDLPKDCLKDLKFSVYGLGDSSYAKFNYVSKILYKRLVDCGAEAMQELVLGDEQHHLGCDGIIYPKLDELFKEIKQTGDCSKVDDNNLPKSSYTVNFISEDEVESVKSEFNSKFFENYDIKTATCLSNDRVTAKDHFQDTRHLKFLAHQPIQYEPGDVCAIIPENLEENTELFIKTLNLDPKQRIAIKKTDPNYMINYLFDFVPDGLTIYELVKCYLDIQSVPKRSFFEFLWPFSDNELEHDKLKEFSSTEGQEEMYEYCVQPKRSILEVLIDFPHTVKNIKFEYIFDLIPPIKARSFSIASSSRMHPNEIHLIVGVVKYQTRMRKTRRGLCSTYLSQLIPQSDSAPGSEIKFTIKSTAFKLPKSPKTPIIMVGPGLGIAPFISFIEERFMLPSSSSNHLYFGCRYEKADFYFKDDLSEYSEHNQLKMSVAFSRHEPKRYVQDLLLEDGALIRDLIQSEGAIFYVAGNSKLPEDTRTILVKILTNCTGDQEKELPDEGAKLINQLETQNRVQYDCW